MENFNQVKNLAYQGYQKAGDLAYQGYQKAGNLAYRAYHIGGYLYNQAYNNSGNVFNNLGQGIMNMYNNQLDYDKANPNDYYDGKIPEIQKSLNMNNDVKYRDPYFKDLSSIVNIDYEKKNMKIILNLDILNGKEFQI